MIVLWEMKPLVVCYRHQPVALIVITPHPHLQLTVFHPIPSGSTVVYPCCIIGGKTMGFTLLFCDHSDSFPPLLLLLFLPPLCTPITYMIISGCWEQNNKCKPIVSWTQWVFSSTCLSTLSPPLHTPGSTTAHVHMTISSHWKQNDRCTPIISWLWQLFSPSHLSHLSCLLTLSPCLCSLVCTITHLHVNISGCWKWNRYRPLILSPQ